MLESQPAMRLDVEHPLFWNGPLTDLNSYAARMTLAENAALTCFEDEVRSDDPKSMQMPNNKPSTEVYDTLSIQRFDDDDNHKDATTLCWTSQASPWLTTNIANRIVQHAAALWRTPQPLAAARCTKRCELNRPTSRCNS